MASATGRGRRAGAFPRRAAGRGDGRTPPRAGLDCPGAHRDLGPGMFGRGARTGRTGPWRQAVCGLRGAPVIGSAFEPHVVRERWTEPTLDGARDAGRTRPRTDPAPGRERAVEWSEAGGMVSAMADRARPAVALVLVSRTATGIAGHLGDCGATPPCGPPGATRARPTRRARRARPLPARGGLAAVRPDLAARCAAHARRGPSGGERPS